MNSFLLNRAQGSIHPLDFHVAQTSHLVRLIEPSPRLRFTCTVAASGNHEEPPFDHGLTDEVVAHKAGVNVLVIDQCGGR
jgi:DNA excision repair protein ERCC-8